MNSDHRMNDAERQALYKTIFTRRDVRAQFIDQPLPEDVLARLLYAAHHAPSVGFMQPWQFILVQSATQREAIYEAFCQANAEAAEGFSGEQKSTYQKLKLEGLKQAAVNLCVVCDRDRAGDWVLGRTHFPEMDLYSTVCAVQNLWLAARAEGVGCGWVSIFSPERLCEILALPDHVVPIAYLCLGYVSHFEETPDLARQGWRERQPLAPLASLDTWSQPLPDEHPLMTALAQQQTLPKTIATGGKKEEITRLLG